MMILERYGIDQCDYLTLVTVQIDQPPFYASPLSHPLPPPPPIHTDNLVHRPTHAGKRVWCALSDFLGLHDAK